MTSAWHFMGRLGPERGGGEFNIEFEFTAAPPGLRLPVYFMNGYRSRTLHSQRFDPNSRACEEDPVSRRDWPTADKTRFVCDVFALPPLEIRGWDFEIALTSSWNPCFVILRWEFREFHMAIAVRPSPPLS